jgi:bifunctional non-homologous end joining protein LigD
MSTLPRGSATPITTRGRGKAVEVEAVVEGVEISNPGRIIDPASGLTKFDLARYHALVADRMLPYVANRPLSTVRCPQGLGKKCFFQKHIGEGFPKAVSSVRVKEKDDKPADYIMIDSVRGLITLVQFGVIEFHPWGSTADDLEHPDYLVFDLDPGPGVSWDDVKEGALHVREVLEGVKLASFLKTSGGKGLHVCVPIEPAADWDTAKAFARAVALHLEKRDPDRYIANMSKDRRKGRIFVDYLRNGRGATSVAPYSVRARPGSGVSMPLAWGALDALGSAAQFTAPDILAGRTELPDPDPWARFLGLKQSIPAEPEGEPAAGAARRRPKPGAKPRPKAAKAGAGKASTRRRSKKKPAAGGG